MRCEPTAETIYWACGSKVAYESQKQALTELRRARQRPTSLLTSQHRVYHCPFCNKWHIGRKKQKRKRRKASPFHQETDPKKD